MRRLRTKFLIGVLPLVFPVAASGCASIFPVPSEPMSVRELVERRDELLGQHVRVIGYLEVLTYLTWTISDGHPIPERGGDIGCEGVSSGEPYQYIDVEDDSLWATLPVHSIHVKRSETLLSITLHPQAVVSGVLEYDAEFGSVRLKHPEFETIGGKFCRVGADDF